MAEVQTKPMWTRCPGCKDRVYNDKLDIGIHRGHCPADLQLRLQELERKFADLKRDVEGIDQQVSEAPAVDPGEIAPWSGDDVDLDQVSQYVEEDVASTVAPEADGWDDDDDNSLASRPQPYVSSPLN